MARHSQSGTGSDPVNGFKGAWVGQGWGKDSRIMRRINRARANRFAAREAQDQFEDEIAGGDEVPCPDCGEVGGPWPKFDRPPGGPLASGCPTCGWSF